MQIEYVLNHDHYTLKAVEKANKQPECIVNCLIEYQAKEDITKVSLVDCTNINGAQWKYLGYNCGTGISITPNTVVSKNTERDIVDHFIPNSKNILLLIKGTNYNCASN